MPQEEIIEFITSCQDSESGGISASVGHDPHMLYTLSAVQVWTTYKYKKTLSYNIYYVHVMENSRIWILWPVY